MKIYKLTVIDGKFEEVTYYSNEVLAKRITHSINHRKLLKKKYEPIISKIRDNLLPRFVQEYDPTINYWHYLFRANMKGGNDYKMGQLNELLIYLNKKIPTWNIIKSYNKTAKLEEIEVNDA